MTPYTPSPRTATARKESGTTRCPTAANAISARQLSRLHRQRCDLTKDEFDRTNRKADKVLAADDKADP